MPFRPTLVGTVGALVVVVATARLGLWQLDRHEQSRERAERMRAAADQPPVNAAGLAAEGDLSWRRVSLDGHFGPAVGLVTGGLVGETPGWHLFAPFRVEGGRTVLVNRGWVPTTLDAERLAALSVDLPGRVDGLLVPLEGPIAVDVVVGASGLPPRWPMVQDRLLGLLPRLVGPPWAAMAASLPGEVVGYGLVAGAELPDERSRTAATLPASGYVLPTPRTHHLSYAAQWFAISALALASWGWAGWSRGRRVGGSS